jgi:hypothetical protein
VGEESSRIAGIYFCNRRECMIKNKKKAFMITTFIIIAAVAIVICAGYFIKRSEYEFDGTLVKIIPFNQISQI